MVRSVRVGRGSISSAPSSSSARPPASEAPPASAAPPAADGTGGAGGWFARPAGWGVATACAAVVVFAAGMYVLVAPDALDPQPFPADAMAVANAGLPATPALDPYDDPLSTFEEDPDLFVWLASEAQPVAME